MNQTERAELRRLMRSRFKVLRSDVAARKVELEIQLIEDIEKQFAAAELTYQDAMFRLNLAVTEANRTANDIGRELHGDRWTLPGHDKDIVKSFGITNPALPARNEARMKGLNEIERRCRQALIELDRQEAQLLTELALTGLQSADAKDFFERIPAVSDLVPAYRLRQLN